MRHNDLNIFMFQIPAPLKQNQGFPVYLSVVKVNYLHLTAKKQLSQFANLWNRR